MSKSIRLPDLKTAANRRLNAHLYCPRCHGQYSANPSDYWYLDNDTVFKCCGVNNILAVRTTVYREVR